jgi:hypothetical protein
MTRRIRLTKFRDLDINDPFFDSLKAAYSEFPLWFNRKRDENVYVVDTNGTKLSGFLYLKVENSQVLDVSPPLPHCVWLKVGTLKIEGIGTKLGERILKKVLDTAISTNADGIYVTVFDQHTKLISLFQRYGFVGRGTKTTSNGTELVLVRMLNVFVEDLRKDYPFVHTPGARFWMLAIYPGYHTRLLPDSILNNEPREIVEDVSYSNTIHKVYISKLSLMRMSPGDVIVFYRTTDGKGAAYFRSVATSVCVVEEVRSRKDFSSWEDYLRYALPSTVFTRDELREQWTTWPRLYIVKMTYNFALLRRITRGRLLDEVGISEHPRWDLRELTRAEFMSIFAMGGADARLIVN